MIMMVSANFYYLAQCLLFCILPVLLDAQRQDWDVYGRNKPYEDRRRFEEHDNQRRRPATSFGTFDLGDKRCNEEVRYIVEKYYFKNDPTVRTSSGGTIVGRYVFLCDGPGISERHRPRPNTDRPYNPTYDNRPGVYKNVTIFLGIPYAKPPTRENNLRFKPPEPPEAQTVIYAKEYKPSCPQNVRYYGPDKGIPEISEDCLYLNVFTPYIETVHPIYPVMVYIHGGFWDHGSATTFPANMLTASQDVVVVTLNYRLGPLGFLATADKESPGNYGIMDQALALQWIYDNIHAFNGDKSRITLFGPDAGAASAGLLAISPKTRDMVKRVIAQSGSAAADWAVIKDPAYMVNTSRIFAENLGCTSYPSWKMVECLKARREGELVTRDIKPLVGWLPWGPVVDLPYLEENLQYIPEAPEVLIVDRMHRFPRDFAYMAGLTRDEGSTMIRDDEELRSRTYVIDELTFHQKVKQYMKIYNYTLNSKAIFDAITFMYSPYEDMRNTTLLRQGYINLLSDSYFTAGNDKMIKLLLDKEIQTYMYVLNYSMEGIPEYIRPKWMGVPHDEEYLMITGAPFMDPSIYPSKYKMNLAQWTEADRNMSEFFMTSWANFAKYGKPTPEQLFNTINWEPMSRKNLQYLPVNSTNSTSIMLTNYRQRESQFWSDYLPSMINKEPPTWPPTVEEPWVQEKRTYFAVFWSVVAIAGLFLILTLLCCILYCRAKSKHIVDDDQIPVPTSTSSVSSISSYGSKPCNVKYMPEKVIVPKKKKDTAV